MKEFTKISFKALDRSRYFEWDGILTQIVKYGGMHANINIIMIITL